MKKVLLVDDELEILEILETLILSEVECEITKCSSGNQAISKLKESDQFDLILSDYNMPDGNGADLFKYNTDNKNLPFVFISGGYLEDYTDVKNFHEVNSLNFFIHKPVDFELLLDHIEKVLFENNTEEQDSGTIPDLSNYSVIKSDFLKLFNVKNYDVFLKINNEKFIKIKNKGDESIEELERYEDKVEKVYYLRKEDFRIFLEEALRDHVNNISMAPANISKVEIIGHSLEIMQDSLKVLGMSNLQIELATKTVESCLTEIMSDKVLSKSIESLFSNKGYFVSHSVTSCFLNYLISKELELDNDTTMKKLTMASLLHDITLADSDLCRIYNKNSEGFETLDRDKKKLVNDHAKECYEMLSKSNSLEGDVLTLIKEHHEWPNGKGFPRGLEASSLFGLSPVLIASLHLADHLFHHGNSADSLDQFLRKLREIGLDNERLPKHYEALVTIIQRAKPNSF